MDVRFPGGSHYRLVTIVDEERLAAGVASSREQAGSARKIPVETVRVRKHAADRQLRTSLPRLERGA